MSIAVVLFLLGLFFIMVIHSANLSSLLKEKVNIVVELQDEADHAAITQLISSQEAVLPGSVRYISKASGLEFMTNGRSIDFAGDNPLQDLIVFNIKAEQYTDTNIGQVKTLLEQREEVSMVYYENMILDNIKDNLNKLSTLILVVGLLFVFMAVVIVRNTINLSMYADRAEILTLQRIGAKHTFVKMPYIKSSVLVGVRGWLMALLFLGAIIAAIAFNFPDIWSSLRLGYILLSLALLLVVAVLIPALVSNSAANSYLKQS